jgi:hypothetical protein
VSGASEDAEDVDPTHRPRICAGTLESLFTGEGTMAEFRTFIELTVVESGLSNVPVPRRFLVDAALIASV